MCMPEVVNPFKEDGTPKTPEEIEQERIDRGLPLEPGSQTDPALLLKSLQDEREKRRILEDELERLRNSSASPDITSDEGKALLKRLEESDKRILDLTKENQKKDILIEYPVLQEKWAEFEKFTSDPENTGMPLRTAAKAYLVENGLLDRRRPGLENPTGGERQPSNQKMSAEDIKVLRETNFKKYQELLSKGLIEP